MSVQPHESWPIPDETRRVAQAVFPKGNLYMRLRDELGEVYADSQFTQLFAVKGQPAESPGRLALITILQYAEGLSDRQTADAVRSRIDWKYALGLELTDPGFHYSVLSEFRSRLLAGQLESQLLDTFLTVLKQRGWLKAKGRQRTDSTHVLAAVRAVNRLELVGETMRRALNELASAAPEWLKGVAQPDWFSRYAQRFDSVRLPKRPAEREQLILTIGTDGITVLHAVYAPTAPEDLRHVPGVEILRRVWIQQFWAEHGEDGPGQLHLRSDDNQPSVEDRIHSPYDPDARYGNKRTVEWVGYKAHVTETCDEGTPHLITNVETTTAAVQDMNMAETIHTSLVAKDLVPSEHLMDAGFVDADLVVEAKRDLGIEVIGPFKKDVRWQKAAGHGYELANFTIDWTAHHATCPQGHTSTRWSEHRNAYDQTVIHITFPKSACEPCPTRQFCTRSKEGVRVIGVRQQAQHEVIQQNRQAQTTPEFWKRYGKRSGIEGTLSQGVRAFDLRCSRYFGLAKTHLQHLAIATAINMHRIFDWLEEIPVELTRTSQFAQLAPDPALVSGHWRF